MKLSSKLERLVGNQLVRSVAALASGTALGQLLMILAMPFLTRLYSPEDFGMMALYVSLVGVLSVSAALRFDIAVPIPKEETEAEDLVWLGLFFGGVCSLILLLLAAILYFSVTSTAEWWVGKAPYIWFIPIGVAFASVYGTLQMWASRKQKFTLIARTRLAQGGGMVVTQLAWGIASLGPFGLILGQMINHALGIASLLRLFISDFKPIIVSKLFRRARKTAIKYSSFPKYSTFEALFNNGGLQVPIVLISLWAAGAEAGYVLLAMQLMQAPMSLLGAAIGQVFFPHASKAPTVNDLDTLTRRTLVNLIRLSVAPLIVVGALAPLLFPYVFGSDWARAGVIVVWMVPWFIMQMLVSPLSMILHIRNKQKLALQLQVFGFLLRVGSIIVPVLLEIPFMVEFYCVSGFVFYFIYLMVVLGCLPGSVRSYYSEWIVFLKCSGVGFVIAVMLYLSARAAIFFLT